jgi:acetolactate synthase-1/2/3 large subunit
MRGHSDLVASTGFSSSRAPVTQPRPPRAAIQGEHQGANIGTLWDVHIDDPIPSQLYRQVHYGEA